VRSTATLLESAGVSVADRESMVNDFAISVMGEYRVSLTSGVAVIVETASPSPAADPILHLLTSDGREVQ